MQMIALPNCWFGQSATAQPITSIDTDDGNGDGAALVDYMKAIAGGMKEEEARAEILMKGRSFEELQEAVADAWRSEGLRLTFF